MSLGDPSLLVTTRNLVRKAEPTSREISVCSFNILMQRLCTHEFFDYTAKSTRKGTNRIPRVLQEIEFLDSDILALQEVDYIEAIQKSFSELYSILYATRPTNRTIDPTEKNSPVNGIAFLLRKNLFIPLKEEVHTFNDLDTLLTEEWKRGIITPDSTDVYSDTLFRHNNIVHLCCVEMSTLSSQTKKHIIFIANTHFHWHPHRIYIRNDQMRHSLRSLLMFRQACRAEFTEKGIEIEEHGFVFCGDFNAQPSIKAYQQYVSSPITNIDPNFDFAADLLEGLVESEKQRVSKTVSETAHQILPFRSSYADIFGEEPKYTNITEKFKGTLDYILYHGAPGHDIHPNAALALPSDELLGEFTALPSPRAGSDHISLKAVFEL
ncbi:putative endonuclease/exonuclease/phosphatase family protein [Blattamonas nauphoetae]|uniref:Endonuclease/exonuclease/phosphatase family protein n=1 Tax=Blattamonas nauphoetae TaxID=2049346 RepID=A0ABQ9XY45_9EUKA|nr:putative endonuclease/exonuclease/phosphatase family protein [Blattamonas nauphoetae]